jgi:hypothetical protein
MSNLSRTEFLERSNYRQRRFRDAARMLPIFAAVLMLLPLMWPRATEDQSLTSSGILYLFGLWVVVVVIAFILSRLLRFETSSEADPDRKARAGE